MGNTGLDAGETPTTHRNDIAAVVYRDNATIQPWDRHSVWYHASEHETSTTDETVNLISRIARLGINTLTIPAGCSNLKLGFIMSRAEKRSIRLLPDISALDSPPSTLKQWLDQGGWGIELGFHHLTELTSRIGGMSLGELQAQVSLAHPESVLSLGLWGDTLEQFDDFSNQVYDAYVHIVRSRPLNLPITSASFSSEIIQLYRLFDSAGTLPAWDLSAGSVHATAGELSPAGVMALALALPGLVHIDAESSHIPPSIRHILRIRQTYQMATANLVLDRSRLADGIVILYAGEIEIRANFSGQPDPIANDGRVLTTSQIELPRADDGNLLLPPGDVAWLKVK
ncbi:hypothetical protein [Arcanobacterium phocae]|uniref:Uncharacterized protein n=1 Tax=Arcanobacterium phocae TaxID=131112 RepID=A0A1H2LLR3_9ACTO|nr:hypothetical protein [Arcanobacterium phocae]SDU81588.1 hypothetical protein SAMN04489737_1558 [Arcanobacterium phocae]